MLFEDLRNRDTEPWEDVTTVQFVSYGQDAGGAVRGIDGDGFANGVDQPDEADASVKVLHHLVGDVSGAIAWRDHLNGEIGRKFKEWPPFVSRRQTIMEYKGCIWSKHHIGIAS